MRWCYAKSCSAAPVGMQVCHCMSKHSRDTEGVYIGIACSIQAQAMCCRTLRASSQPDTSCKVPSRRVIAFVVSPLSRSIWASPSLATVKLLSCVCACTHPELSVMPHVPWPLPVVRNKQSPILSVVHHGKRILSMDVGYKPHLRISSESLLDFSSSMTCPCQAQVTLCVVLLVRS